MSDIVVSRNQPAVAIVTITRPARRNACNLAAWRDLARVFTDLGHMAEVRLVVLTGAAGHFCAGADIGEFAAVRADAESGAAYEREVEACYAAIEALPQPSIAAIDGYCVGGGCALALCCDFRVLHRGARFGIPAARLGTVYSPRECRLLYACVGLSHAKRILYGGELLGAAAGLGMGFANEMVDGVVVERAIAFGMAMMENAPLSIAAAKLTLQSLATGDLAGSAARIEALTRQAFDSDDYREGAAAFLEKRPPRFVGR